MYGFENIYCFKLEFVLVFIKMKRSTGLLASLVFFATFTGGSLCYLQNCSKEIFRYISFNKKDRVKRELIYSEDVWVPNHTLAEFELANQMIYIVEGKTNMVLTDLVGEKTIDSLASDEKLEIIYLTGTNYFRNNINNTTALGRATATVFLHGNAFYNDKREGIRKRRGIEKRKVKKIK